MSSGVVLRRTEAREPSLRDQVEAHGAQRCCAPTETRLVRYACEMNRDGPKPPVEAGLCPECANARRVESERGSVFVMCQLSATDANYPKYPRLPVFSCAGYLRREEPGTANG
jgi:hypothetical protein